MRRIATLLAILWTFVSVSSLQAQPKDRTIDEQTQRAIIDSVLARFDKHYVFADVAQKMDAHVRQRYDSGAYKNITSLTEFARMLDDDLRAVSQDKHIGVSYRSDESLETELNTAPDSAEMQRRIEESRYENFYFDKVERLLGNIGYLKFNQFEPAGTGGPTAVAALDFLAHTDALIIDLTTNGGGEPSMVQFLVSHFVDSGVHYNDSYVRGEDRTEQWRTLANVPGSHLTAPPVYILVSRYTFSAAEDFAYTMQHLGRAVIIGETTAGGAHEWDYFNCPYFNLEVRVPFKRTINVATSSNWEGVGVKPDHPAATTVARDVAYLEAAKATRKCTDDEAVRSRLDWVIATQESKLTPTTISVDVPAAYAGVYGDISLTAENGTLYFQRVGGMKKKLLPMSNVLFRFDSNDYNRVEIGLDAKGTPEALIYRNINGGATTFVRSE